jgi:hypothetical protein
MTRHFNIEIETTDRWLDMEMLGADQVSAGTQISLADGSTVTWSSAPLKKYAGDPYVFNLVVGLVSAVGVGVFSNWLYDKLKQRPAKLRINRTEVEIEPNKIRIVVEQIEKDGQ